MTSPVGPVSGQTVQETQSDAPAFNIVDYKVHTIALAAITATFIAIAIPTHLGGLLAGAVLGMGSFPSLYEIFAPTVNEVFHFEAETPSITVDLVSTPQTAEPINQLTHKQRMQDLHAIRSALPNHNDVPLDPYENSPEAFDWCVEVLI